MCNGCGLVRFQPQPNNSYHPNFKGGRAQELAADVPSPSAFSEARSEQELQPSPSPPSPLVQFMKYMVHSVLVHLVLKYQGNPDTLFLESPTPVCCFLEATSAYWLTVDQMRTSLNGKLLQRLRLAAFASAVLSALSLLSMVLRYPVSLVPLLIWTPLPFVLACPKAYVLFHGGIKGVGEKVEGMFVWATELNSAEEASNSPV